MTQPKIWLYSLALAYVILYGCVEPITVDAEFGSTLVVVEGAITDQQGPHVVRLSRGVAISEMDTANVPIEEAKVILLSSAGLQELLTETSPGRYETSQALRGQVGTSYWVRLSLPDGRVYESDPELMMAGGTLDEVHFQYEARTRLESFGEVNADVFNVLVDGTAAPGRLSYTRWKLERTFQARTEPSLHFTWNPPYSPYKNPFPCSGYILLPGPEGSGGILAQVGPCECCDCWVSQVERAPQLSDNRLVQNGRFSKVKIGEVPVNSYTLQINYQVKVTQLNLSKAAFDYFERIRDQRESAASILQPALAKVTGNIRGVNTDRPAIGLFWAASAQTVVRHLKKEDLPRPIPAPELITLPCHEFYQNAILKKPVDWVD